MGGGMAVNLAKNGHAVSVWNRSSESTALKRAIEAGCTSNSTIQEAVKDADIIFTCLSEEKDITEVVFGKNGIAENAKVGAIVIDMGTTGVECARETAKKLAEKKIKFIDAPVSGGDVGAREGTLTIMVGGDKNDFEKVRPYFECMGKNVHYCGETGAGQAVKLCNQILCAVNMLGVCEAFKLADEMKINRNLIVDICGTGAAGSWALTTLGKRVANGDYKPGFRLGHMLKDMKLVKDASKNLDLPGVKLATDKFQDSTKYGATQDDSGTQSMMLAYDKKCP